MKIVIFDTETTGLPKTREAAWKGPNNWPHIVSISWIVIENDVITKENYAVIKPIDWVIPEESTKIHGIAHTYAMEGGETLSNVMDRFWMDVEGATVIAHNLQFDENVIANAMLWDLRRAWIGFPKKFCTMESSRIICKIPFATGKGYKSPKLSELYTTICRKTPSTTELHNALYDTRILAEIVQTSFVLRQMIGLPMPSVTQNKQDARPTVDTCVLSFNLSQIDSPV